MMVGRGLQKVLPPEKVGRLNAALAALLRRAGSSHVEVPGVAGRTGEEASPRAGL